MTADDGWEVTPVLADEQAGPLIAKAYG